MVEIEKVMRAIVAGVTADWKHYENGPKWHFLEENPEGIENPHGYNGYNIHVEGPGCKGMDGYSIRFHHDEAPDTRGLLNVIAVIQVDTPAEAINVINRWIDNRDRMLKERVMGEKSYSEVGEKYTP